jgi:hypothetical protein
MRAHARLFAMLVIAAVALAACMRGGNASGGDRSASGTLIGQIVRGPTFPISGPGVPSPAAEPVAGAELRIVDSGGALVATARTGADGHYRVTLPAGEYRVERGAGFSGATKNLPSKIAISPGGETRFDVWVDTGIR